MSLTSSQKQIIKGADSDGRVFVRYSEDVRKLLEENYLEPSGYSPDCYFVRRNIDGSTKNY
jgi:hypothetical protein